MSRSPHRSDRAPAGRCRSAVALPLIVAVELDWQRFGQVQRDFLQTDIQRLAWRTSRRRRERPILQVDTRIAHVESCRALRPADSRLSPRRHIGRRGCAGAAARHACAVASGATAASAGASAKRRNRSMFLEPSAFTQSCALVPARVMFPIPTVCAGSAMCVSVSTRLRAPTQSVATPRARSPREVDLDARHLSLQLEYAAGRHVVCTREIDHAAAETERQRIAQKLCNFGCTQARDRKLALRVDLGCKREATLPFEQRSLLAACPQAELPTIR